MPTIVLMWNPAISSMTTQRYDDWFYDMLTNHEDSMDWSVWDWEHASVGDQYVMIRVGDSDPDRNGLVHEGLLASRLYEGDDWAGSDRRRHYAELLPMTAWACAEGDIITTEMLQKAVPDFDWTGGHSGRLLTPEQASALKRLLKDWRGTHRDQLQDFNLMRVRQKIELPGQPGADFAHQALLSQITDPAPVIDAMITEATNCPLDKILRDVVDGVRVAPLFDNAKLTVAREMAQPIKDTYPRYALLCLLCALDGESEEKVTASALNAREGLRYVSSYEEASFLMRLLLKSLNTLAYREPAQTISPECADIIENLDIIKAFFKKSQHRANPFEGVHLLEIVFDCDKDGGFADVILGHKVPADTGKPVDVLVLRFDREIGIKSQGMDSTELSDGCFTIVNDIDIAVHLEGTGWLDVTVSGQYLAALNGTFDGADLRVDDEDDAEAQ